MSKKDDERLRKELESLSRHYSLLKVIVGLVVSAVTVFSILSIVEFFSKTNF